MHRHAAFASILLLLNAGCGSEAAAATPDLAGTWAEADGGRGYAIDFETASSKFLLHGPGPTGRDHDHFEGGFVVTGGEVVLTGVWESNQKAEVVKARIVDGGLHAAVAGKPLVLRKRT